MATRWVRRAWTEFAHCVCCIICSTYLPDRLSELGVQALDTIDWIIQLRYGCKEAIAWRLKEFWS